jgi:hypothetical protein
MARRECASRAGTRARRGAALRAGGQLALTVCDPGRRAQTRDERRDRHGKRRCTDRSACSASLGARHMLYRARPDGRGRCPRGGAGFTARESETNKSGSGASRILQRTASRCPSLHRQTRRRVRSGRMVGADDQRERRRRRRRHDRCMRLVVADAVGRRRTLTEVDVAGSSARVAAAVLGDALGSLTPPCAVAVADAVAGAPGDGVSSIDPDGAVVTHIFETLA